MGCHVTTLQHGSNNTKMKGILLFLCIVFLLKHKVTDASLWTEDEQAQSRMYLHGSTLGTRKVDTVFQCYRHCEDNIHCASINMNHADKTCELKHSTKTTHQYKKSDEHNILYMKVRDALGSTPRNPILSCKWFKNLDNQVKSGVYWMKFNEPSSVPFKVFCDMITDGGGWTLVYSYTFTQYSNFGSWSNAMTPIPNWPLSWSSSSWVPQSTTTPLSESSHSAMDFTLWKKIGNEFLVKPNITNWVACVEGTGSFVNWVSGSLTCRIVKVMTPKCTDVVPSSFEIIPPNLLILFTDARGSYLVLEGRKDSNWPTHDPCGTNSQNHLTNVQYPGGVWYLR